VFLFFLKKKKNQVETDAAQAVCMLEGVRVASQRAARRGARALYMMVLESLCTLLVRMRRFAEVVVVVSELQQLDESYPVADLNLSDMWAAFGHLPCSLTLCNSSSSYGGNNDRKLATKQFYLRGVQYLHQPLVLVDAPADSADPIELTAITAPPLRFSMEDRDVRYYSLAALWFGWCDATSLPAKEADAKTMFALVVSKFEQQHQLGNKEESQVRKFGYFSAVPMWSGAERPSGSHRLYSLPLSGEKQDHMPLLIDLSQVCHF